MYDLMHAGRDWLIERWAWISEILSTQSWNLSESLANIGEFGRIALWVTSALALGLATVLVIAMVRNHGPNATLAQTTRRPRLLGYLVLVLFLVLFGGWSAIAPLASAALAPGVVSPDGNRKTVQHLEGGIIKAIYAHEGDRVRAGAPLVALDDTQARARLQELREGYAHLVAVQARLRIEQEGGERIVFPDEFYRIPGVDHVGIVKGQQVLMKSRLATRQGRESILEQRVKQLNEEISGLRQVVSAQGRQIKFFEEEMKSVSDLYSMGLETLSRLLNLRRGLVETEAQRASNYAKIARDRQEIGETHMQILTMREQFSEKVDEDLTKVTAEVAGLRSKIAEREDIQKRTLIRAPASGVVMNLRVTTDNGVIQPGQPILDIVPQDAKLIIDAQVAPTDIDTVRPGMRARVLLTAYRQRNLPQIHGTLRSVSADRMVEDTSGKAYFLAKVEVDPDELVRLDGVRMIPGMPAEVMILSGERTFLQYMLRPLTESLTRSFRES